ncbi:MAG TPA: hypothetical protein VEF04_06895 [Blastocatellia bacterium]|nr:hypothetical protein [Blastocatellia bacterium]
MSVARLRGLGDFLLTIPVAHATGFMLLPALAGLNHQFQNKL